MFNRRARDGRGRFNILRACDTSEVEAIEVGEIVDKGTKCADCEVAIAKG